MPTTSATYAPLWCKSNYSFLEGASHPDELVETAHQLGLRALALTDRDGVYGMVRAHVKARELGFHLIVGSEITLQDETNLVLLAMTRKGYANLCRLISDGRLRSPKGTSRVSWEEVCEHADDLIALWGGPNSALAGMEEPEMSGPMRDAFGDRLHALLTRHEAAGETRLEHRIRERAKNMGLATVAGMEVLYHTTARRDLQDVMTCIRHGVTLANAGRLTKPNAGHALRAPDDFLRLYADDPDSVLRTLEISNRCQFSLAEIRYRYPLENLPGDTTPSQWLRQLVMQGAAQRYPSGLKVDAQQQLEKELTLIRDLDYEGYFLTMWEIVRFCRENDILCQGRGSAANSVVCYCLGITAIDPVSMGLLFERFISRERAEPPDIDLDIEHDRREEVVQHVYRKHGRRHAAMVANFIRYRTRSALRDVGRALGFPETSIERLARHAPHYEKPEQGMFNNAGLDLNTPAFRHLLRLTAEIQNMPRHLSIHPGGFLLGHEPVSDLVPVENATMPDRTVIQWDKEDVEDLGLFKVDLLGLGALNVVHRCFDLIKRHEGKELTLATIPPDDQPTYEMIQRADTVGVFQIESRAQMSMLPRLKPKDYYDLVIEVSIVRPGPITGGMVHPYLRRRNEEEEITYPHDCLKPVLKKTLGIPLFQEQVMQLAMIAADYTPGEADQLRRDMAAWRSAGRIERHQQRLIERMTRKGIPREFAERVFEQIRGFGEYGFPESHAASFALIAYATSWMKCHHPAAFLCAMLNAQPMGFYSAATLVQDGQRHGVEIRPVDVQTSNWDCTLERQSGSGEGHAVRMGLCYVRGLSEAVGERVMAVRRGRPFQSLDDFARRTGFSTEIMSHLTESGAFECFRSERRNTLWNVLSLETANGEQESLDLDLAGPDVDFGALDSLETIRWDREFTGHSPRGHPLAPLRDELNRRGLPDASTINHLQDGSRVHYAGMVICRQRPGTANGVVFMTLEDETGFVNLVIWEKVFQKFQILARTESLLGVSGKLQNQSGVTHLIAQRLWSPRLRSRPIPQKSRDFH